MPTSRASKRTSRLGQWWRRLYAALTGLSWRIVLPLGALHVVLSWWGLYWAGEADLLPLNTFWYFYATTATTVGYGDLSPSTPYGRYVVTLFVMPGGITLFTSVLAKTAQNLSDLWRRAMTGLKSYEHIDGHIVLLGWEGAKSSHMIDLIRADSSEQRELILMATLEENPAADRAQYVRGSSLTDEEALHRAGVANANLIIAFGTDDNHTLTAALAAGALNPNSHLVAYFAEQGFAQLLERHCPNAESVVSVSMENTVRAAQDPGSSRVLKKLLSSMDGQTQYLMRIPDGSPEKDFASYFQWFKEHHNATILALRDSTGSLRLNPDNEHRVGDGDAFYYIAERRLDANEISWP